MGDTQYIKQLIVTGSNQLEIEGKTYLCTIGRNGKTAQKREGDLKTPTGSFPLRECFYRPDRLAPPQTMLPLYALTQEDGWCDDENHSQYNRLVKLPFEGRHEKLWRDDYIYDLIIPLGYNDETIIPGAGSAIFLHLMRPDGIGTEGCVAVEKETLLTLLPRLTTQTRLIVV